MNKLKKILHSTITKVISLMLVISFSLSVFFFFDFYKRQYNKIKGYYWVYRGDKAFKKKDLSNAIFFYEHAIKLHPKHYRAMYNLANIYVVYEDYYSALKNYEKALLVRPDYEVARIDYAIILFETYKTDEAIEQYEKVLSNKPKFIKIPFLVDNKKSYNYNRGVAYYNMGLAYRTKSLLAGLNKSASRDYLEKAGSSYKEASNILKSYNSNYNLGLIHQLLKNQNQAGYYYCQAISISPMEYEAHFNLAILLNDMKDYKNASEEFKKAGLLLDSRGDSEKTKYVYDTLYEVSKKIAASDDKSYLREIKDNENAKYKAGKLVIDAKNHKKDEFDKSFANCSGAENFGVNNGF